MLVYHEINPSALEDVLKNGLVRSSRGEKGNDKWISETDALLDDYCPMHLKKLHVSRDNNLYAYVATEGDIIDITTGRFIPIDEFVSDSDSVVLEIDIQPSICFVSDLDAYDAALSCLKNNAGQKTLEQVATTYWSKVVPIKQFSIRDIKRPEIMITTDVPPKSIHVLRSSI